MKVTMGCLYPIIQVAKDAEKRHTVGSTAQCDEMEAFAVKKRMFRYIR